MIPILMISLLSWSRFFIECAACAASICSHLLPLKFYFYRERSWSLPSRHGEADGEGEGEVPGEAEGIGDEDGAEDGDGEGDGVGVGDGVGEGVGVGGGTVRSFHTKSWPV